MSNILVRPRVPAILAILYLSGVCPAQATQYQIINLGGEGSRFSLYNPKVNNAGQVLMESQLGTQLWRNGVVTLISDSNTGRIPLGYGGLNNQGDVAGAIIDLDPLRGNAQSPVLWQDGPDTILGTGSFTELGAPPGAGTSHFGANGINDSGQILVGGGAGYVWQGGSYMKLPDLDATGSIATAINNSGQVTGNSGINAQLVMWSGGSIAQLPPLALSQPGVAILSTVGLATDINDAGQIVGFTDFGKVGGEYVAHAFRYTAPGVNSPTGEMLDIGGLASPFGSLVGSSYIAINNSGHIVGYWHQLGSTGVSDPHYPEVFLPFVLDNGILTDINTLLPADSGWKLRTASDVNDLGQIVGIGIDPGGHSVVYLLTPIPVPEPSTLALLAVGGVMLAAAVAKRLARSAARDGNESTPTQGGNEP